MKKFAFLVLMLALAHVSWGQLMFRTTLTGWEEVPPRETPAWGIGHAMLDLETNGFTFEYSFEGLLAPQTAAHIHVAPRGANGPVLYPLPNGSPSSVALILTDEDVMNLRAGNWYVNVHSQLYPGGEIRGQFVPVPEPSTFALAGALLLGAAVVVRRKWRRFARPAAV